MGLRGVARGSIIVVRARGKAKVQADTSFGKVYEWGAAVGVSKALGECASVAYERLVVKGDFDEGLGPVDREDALREEGVGAGVHEDELLHLEGRGQDVPMPKVG